VQEAGLGRAIAPGVPRGYVWIFNEARWLTLAEADAWLAQDSDLKPSGCVRGKPALDV